MRKGNDIPLHKRIHFRRVREVITEIAEYEGFNPGDYDFFKMTAYETVGENLKGKNVSYNIKNGRSCFVYNNKYDVVEVPSLSNRQGSPYGRFLYFIYNSSFHYHVFGEMTVTLDAEASRRSGTIHESVHFKNYGKFDVIFGEENKIHKSEYGSLFDPGADSDEHNFGFDTYSSRKKAYKTDRYKILASIGVKNTDPYKAIGRNEVKVYKKKPAAKRQQVGKAKKPSYPKWLN
jgi:hypothetical protein